MNYYESKINNVGVNYGGVLIQANGQVGGTRSVFVKLVGQGKNGLVFPPIGGIVKNPFKGFAKAYAGDLAEYQIDGSVYILKTYEVAETVSTAANTIKIVRDGYRHVPFVGDVLMVAPKKLTTKGTALTVTAVSADDDAWTLTLSATTTVTAGDVLVEANSDGSWVVSNPNAFIPSDVDFLYEPQASSDDFEGARYLLTPCLANEDTKLYISKMSVMPQAILDLNESKVEGWFNL